MIRLTCTNCKAVLSIDDGFAGGVCRCQFCGTIQTVPSKSAGIITGKQTQKSLYKTQRGSTGGTGLDDLANAVSSSGLRDRLAQPKQKDENSPPLSHDAVSQVQEKGESSKNIPLIILLSSGATLILVLLIALVIWLATGGKKNAPAPSTPASAIQSNKPTPQNPVVSPPTPRITGPSFCSLKLDYPSVIYLLDRGDSTRFAFADLKAACLMSIETLGPKRKFQVCFWSNGNELAYPESLTPATNQNLAKLQTALEDVFASGATSISNPLKKALAQKPAIIVMITGKGDSLEDDFTKEVLAIRGKATVKIHTISLSPGGSSSSPPLKAIAQATGGTYLEISEQDLKNYASYQP